MLIVALMDSRLFSDPVQSLSRLVPSFCTEPVGTDGADVKIEVDKDARRRRPRTAFITVLILVEKNTTSS